MEVVEARINKEWAVRLVIIAVMFIGGGAWFLYDGLVKYPEINRRFLLTHFPVVNDEVMDPPEGVELDQWRPDAQKWLGMNVHYPQYMSEFVWQTKVKQRLALIEAKGYDARQYDPTLYEGTPPGMSDLPAEPKQDWAQLIIAACCFPIGLLAVLWLIGHARRRIVADDEGVHFAGQTIRYDEITEIDRTRWDSKGIVVLIAGERRMKLDDWKFRGADRVLQRVDERRPGGGAEDPQETSATDPQPTA